MRTIDLQTWPRREHFKLFSTWDHPHFSMCANVDLTEFQPFVKQKGFSITVAIVYLITRTANLIPEFRYRIRPGAVVEHEVVHPSTTILAGDDLFTFCWFDYFESFRLFNAGAAERIASAKIHPTLGNIPGRDDFLYMTAIPWVSFTSFIHPMHLQPADSVPRFAWGKFFQDGERLLMPLGVQGHHALMDGFHMGKFYSIIQEANSTDYFETPKSAGYPIRLWVNGEKQAEAPAQLNCGGGGFVPNIPVTGVEPPAIGGEVLIPVTGVDLGAFGHSLPANLFSMSLAFFGLGLVLNGIARKQED